MVTIVTSSKWLLDWLKTLIPFFFHSPWFCGTFCSELVLPRGERQRSLEICAWPGAIFVIEKKWCTLNSLLVFQKAIPTTSDSGGNKTIQHTIFESLWRLASAASLHSLLAVPLSGFVCSGIDPQSFFVLHWRGAYSKMNKFDMFVAIIFSVLGSILITLIIYTYRKEREAVNRLFRLLRDRYHTWREARRRPISPMTDPELGESIPMRELTHLTETRCATTTFHREVRFDLPALAAREERDEMTRVDTGGCKKTRLPPTALATIPEEPEDGAT